MSRYIIDTNKDISIYERLILTPLRCLEDADKAIDDAYQRGFEDGRWKAEDGCTGCKYEGLKEYEEPCAHCCNAYKNYWTEKRQFVRGDEVVDENGIKGIVVSSENDEDSSLYVLFNEYRVPQNVTQKFYKKTGKHYDIDKFLDEIKGDSDK